jgi:hypothetical protein
VCVPVGLLPQGLSPVGGDCDDRDASRFRAVMLHEDNDGDGVTGPPLGACVGQEPPTGASLTPTPAPTLALEPRRWTTAPLETVPESDIERWDELERLMARQGEAAQCEAQEDERCEPLVASDFGLALPEGATVLGLKVHVQGRQGDWDNDAAPSVEAHLLAPDGARSEPRLALEPWRRQPEDHAFGAQDDRWGLPLTAAALNDPRFAVVLTPAAGQEHKLDVSALWLEVWHDAGADCDDQDPTRARTVYGYLDRDGDHFGAGLPVRACLEGMSRLGFSSHPDDCYDDHPQAHPHARQAQPTDRGDGSFDYNCDGQASPALLTFTTACDGDPMTGCSPTSATRTPDAPCGQPNEVGACTTQDAACALETFAVPTACK